MVLCSISFSGAWLQFRNEPMPHATHLLPLFIVIQLFWLATSSHGHGHGNTRDSSYCHPDQAAALLELKQSFIFDYSTTTLPSWQPGTDCCSWEGVRCDDGVSGGGGSVTVLDLGGRGLYSYGCHAALFNLTSLRYLDLSMNDFGGSHIPAVGFERLSKLTHLNLSYSGFYGQIPLPIGKLTNLVSLDLSSLHNIESDEITNIYSILDGYNFLVLREPSFEILLANLTNLRELYLDGVDISSSGEGWSSGLGIAVPHIQILSMVYCQLHGPIHTSLSSLRSLTVVNLKLNGGISGAVPEFFTDFLNLSVLQLSYNNFSGWFPQTIFQLKNIRVLDVSHNKQLLGYLPEFPSGASLETLCLQSTNFSGVRLSSFSNLLSLRELGFAGRSISMEPTDLLFNKINSLQILQLPFAQFSGELGPFFSWIRSLKNLTSLHLSDCYSSKIMPPMIGNLTNLTSLEITECGFVGQIPSSIGNLNKLTSLRISDSAFSGTIPSSIGNLKKLRRLEISYSELSGPITTDFGHLSTLTVLVLTACRFSGRIPSTIMNLTQLIYLDLSQNDLRGEIPTYLFTSPAMLQLDLSLNKLSGPIQEFDTTYSRMRIVSLSENQISGQIPASFFELRSLVDLDLHTNNLTGLVQLISLWKLRKLYNLDLSNNKLYVLDSEGSEPTMPVLPKLLMLGLMSCNMTTIPRFLMHLNHVQILDLSCNVIDGIIPKCILETWDDGLISLNLSHNKFTDMQLTSYVLPNSRLESLDVSFNRLQGQIPMPNMLATVWSLPQVLDYSNNRFSSIMSNFTVYLSQTVYLKLSRNKLSGHISHSICKASKLEVLDLSYNNFSGLIPSCLMEDGHLAILNLRENHFEGTLPDNVNEHCNLQTIDLHDNKIQGQLPRSLSNCADLEVLDVGNNQMIDNFPSWLSRLSNLYVLILRSNQFYGSLPYTSRDSKFEEYFPKLRIVDISSNNFHGNLHPEWFQRLTSMMAKFNDTGSTLTHQIPYRDVYYHDTVAITYKGQYMAFEKVLTTLTAIDFSNNAFDSQIPETTGKLISLHTLNMSHNAFTGKIPPQMAEMRQLESLDLSSNELSGEIPQELTNLTFLATLNLSENKLHGRIPQSRQFATFENNSYKGNVGLCGLPLSKPCGNSSNPNEAQVNICYDHVDIILFLFAGLGFGIGFTTAILVKWGKVGKWFRIA
ncbi:receptor-like protein 7 [Triticum dicoccoides]|uniref:receptor-like protein 7 n=1 Tax=Triticum dicoccoides TaxID=85692 RepID=UPI00188FD8A8|nr:receptor-like protein 7 [Triticum dicoccoides]